MHKLVLITNMSILASYYLNISKFHEFLKLENEIGNIMTQEAVSIAG